MMSERSVLSHLTVKRGMRRNVNTITVGSPLSKAISVMVKNKINGILITQDDGMPTGVISKTDLMGGYYAGFPLDTAVENIMSTPPLLCNGNEMLENALKLMRSKNVYRVYVTTLHEKHVAGVLAYPDIVGLLYKFCFNCDYSIFRRGSKKQNISSNHIRVQDVMRTDICSIPETNTIGHAIEELSAFKMGALTVQNNHGELVGVISKTDLVFAYKNNIDLATPAAQIMTTPVHCCNEHEPMEKAIKQMIQSDVRRLFVTSESEEYPVGVFALPDAARSRSGSCHGCISSRIQVDA